MQLVKGTNDRGNLWRLELSAAVDGRFMPCDRLATKPSADSYSADCGSLLVLEVGESSLVVEAEGGWMYMQGRYVIRIAHCPCSSHWRR